jgi:hypothetical protein
MRDIDGPHHTEDQLEASREKCVEAAEQDALNDDVDDFHRFYTPK